MPLRMSPNIWCDTSIQNLQAWIQMKSNVLKMNSTTLSLKNAHTKTSRDSKLESWLSPMKDKMLNGYYFLLEQELIVSSSPLKGLWRALTTHNFFKNDKRRHHKMLIQKSYRRVAVKSRKRNIPISPGIWYGAPQNYQFHQQATCYQFQAHIYDRRQDYQIY